MDRVRLGLTMRVTDAPSYVEKRDSIAQDWFAFLQNFPELDWVLLPNIGGTAPEYARRLGVNRIVFSGGNDLGDEPSRDRTEGSLVDWAIGEKIPVLGVCRGAQLLQHHRGGELVAVERETHVAAEHAIRITRHFGDVYDESDTLSVNSYHALGIARDALAAGLVEFAHSDDGFVEGFYLEGEKVAAILWHPERMGPSLDRDVVLFRYFLRGYESSHERG